MQSRTVRTEVPVSNSSAVETTLRACVVALLVAVAYYACARLGYTFAIPRGIVALWPPSGLMLGLLLSSQRREWAAVVVGGLLGSIVSDLQSGYAVPLAIAAAVANGSETLVAASLVNWRLGKPISLSTLREVAVLVAGAGIVSNAMTALLGMLVLHFGFHTSLSRGWFVWWVGDGLGMLMVAPVMITGLRALERRRVNARIGTEGAVVFIALGVLAQITLGPVLPWSTGLGPFVVFPFLLWAGLRLGPAGAAGAAFIVAAVATWNAAFGAGPFAGGSLSAIDSAMQTYAYLAVAGACALIPAAAVAELEESSRRHATIESRMAFALEASRVGTWEADLERRVARLSPTFETLHGLVPGMFGGTFAEFFDRIDPEDRDRVRASLAAATRGRTDSNVLYRTMWPDGSVHWINVIGHTFYSDAGVPLRAAGVGIDVTERHSLEERIRQSQKMEAVGQLAGGVAHDFNNLLTVIKGYGSMLADALRPGSQESFDVAEMLSAAERATALTRQLLAFSRREVLAPRALNVSVSLRALEPMLRRLIGEQIVLIVSPGEVEPVIADPSEVEQIIVNLAVNARDAMPGGGRLTLQTSNVDVDATSHRPHGGTATGPHVMIAVTDTGTGIDDSTLAHMFEPFFTTKPVGQGTGLGLATVYGIAKRGGGHVTVQTELGQGTTFNVYLPCATDRPVETSRDARVESPVGSERVLLVEDDEAIRSVASRILAMAGYEVSSAPSGAEALDLVDRSGTEPELLLTDVVLPEMSGRQLAERLAERFPDMKILYMSGYTDDVIVRLGVLEYDVQFLQKPFLRADLLNSVRKALDRAHA